jgi:hypothetical protein
MPDINLSRVYQAISSVLTRALRYQGMATLANCCLTSMDRESLLSCERNRDFKRLLTNGFRRNSLYDEDGLIHEYLRSLVALQNETTLHTPTGEGETRIERINVGPSYLGCFCSDH